MMINSQTAVLEKNTVLSGEFATEPFECAWAKEARWFFQTIESAPGASVSFRTQVSPDGLHWIDIDDDVQTVADESMGTWVTREFGHWLRVAGKVSDGAAVKVRIYLALKG
ncbi:DUF6385 domain-containing protein [Microbacterium sp. OR16]|uniref:DUF6385 domain-containing protein n=1 Tax=Microbacterium sp. OR16 TaxID=3095345 RepID=UPI0039B3BA7E